MKINDLYKTNIENLFLNNNFYDFFSNWIVGFTEAEGSFYFVKIENGKLRPEFRLSQNHNYFLLNKIKETLKLSRKITLQTNSKIHYYLISVNKKDIENTIKFFTNKDLVQLKGKKLLNFQLWLKGMK